ncbi:MAG TPA: substrate-binding domain-containing protein, partial [Pedobacter sp.]|nr:substrate-binding domain-containing protein [Pedobacter sp.]
YLNKQKWNVPEKISVLSFDESDAFDLFYTPITFSRQPLTEMGSLAVTNLIKLMNGDNHLRQISLEARLVAGNSCKEQ